MGNHLGVLATVEENHSLFPVDSDILKWRVVIAACVLSYTRYIFNSLPAFDIPVPCQTERAVRLTLGHRPKKSGGISLHAMTPLFELICHYS